MCVFEDFDDFLPTRRVTHFMTQVSYTQNVVGWMPGALWERLAHIQCLSQDNFK